MTAIDVGTEAELAPLELGDQVAGLTPYYVRATVTNESGLRFPFASFPAPRGLLGDGGLAQSVSVNGDFAPCDSGSAPQDFIAAGDSFEICGLSLAGPGSMVTGAQSIGPNVDVEGAPDYGRDPVIWS